MGKNKVKQPLRRTALGLWLKEKAPEVAEAVGDVLPDRGALGIVRKLLDKHASEDVKAEAEAEITTRWASDNEKQQPLSSRIRPLIVLGSCVAFVAFALLDSLQVVVLKSEYISLLESLLLTSVGGYFVLRSADKFTQR